MCLSYYMLNLYSLFNKKYKNFQNILKNDNYIFTISDICPLSSLCTLFIKLLINDNSIDNEKSKNDHLLYIYRFIFGIQIIFHGFLLYSRKIKQKSKIDNNKLNLSINNLKEINPISENMIDNEINNIGKNKFSLNIINLNTIISSCICSKKPEFKDDLNFELKINEKLGIFNERIKGKSFLINNTRN